MHQRGEVGEARGVDPRAERAGLRADRAGRLDRGAAEIGDRESFEAKVLARPRERERERAAVDLAFAEPGDVDRARFEGEREIDVAQKIATGADIGKRVDVERVRAQIHEQPSAIGADRAGGGERTGERRSLEHELQVSRGESGRGEVDVACHRGRTIGERCADGVEPGRQFGRSRRKPFAKAAEIAEARVEPPLEAGGGAEFDGSGSQNMAAAGRARLQRAEDRGAGRDGRRHRDVGDGVAAEDRRRGRRNRKLKSGNFTKQVPDNSSFARPRWR